MSEKGDRDLLIGKVLAYSFVGVVVAGGLAGVDLAESVWAAPVIALLFIWILAAGFFVGRAKGWR